MRHDGHAKSIAAHDLMRVWEWGRHRHPIDRSLALLSVALDRERDELADLTVGQRDAYLFRLREDLFGSTLELQVACPNCEEGYEFDVPVAQVLVADIAEPTPNRRTYRVELGERHIDIRLPTSRDLARVANLDGRAARRQLVETCQVQAADPPLNDAEVADLADAILARDPQAEIHFPIRCAVCDNQWVAELDISQHLWAELDSWAERMMRDVVLLACNFGWREADILVMSDERRARYVDLAQK